jgi:putative NIF3 family GTP cyclohydrolase 1 type 2
MIRSIGTPPDDFLVALVEALGWQTYARPNDPYHVTIPPANLAALARTIQTRLKANTMRVVGDPNLVITQIALVPGAAGLETQVAALRSQAVELLIAGEASEWETVEYVRDATAQGRHKALILLGHEVSEEPGMEKCAQDLRLLFPGLKVEHISAGNPMWVPGGAPSYPAVIARHAK